MSEPLALEPVPYNHPAELAVIGALTVYGPEAVPLLDGLSADDLSPDHGIIYAAAHRIATGGSQPDLVLITNELGPDTVGRLGGTDTLKHLLIDAYGTVVGRGSVTEYARVVADNARARRTQAVGLELARNPANGHATQLIDQLADLRHGHTARALRLTPAASVDIGRPHWVWDQRIPVGGVTLMVGREGHGKTLLVCWLAARITQGQLNGERRGQPADVIYIGLEDDRSTVINPRLIAAGADLDRFHFVDLTNDVFTLEQHVHELTHAIADLNVGLVVIDPIDAHLGVENSHNKGEVQAAIGRLAELTQHHRCGALGLAHFNKNAGVSDVLTRIAGSRALSSAVRSVLGVGPHPVDEDDRLCILAKANNASVPDVPAIRFRIEGATLPNPDPADDHNIITATTVMAGEEHGYHPDEILAGTTPESRSNLEDAIDWLHSYLAHGPQPKASAVEVSKAEGITPKLLRTARERLGVIAERDDTAQGRPSVWRLPATNETTPIEGQEELIIDPDQL